MVHDVVTVGPDEPVSKAVQLMVDHDISALPVVDDDRHVIGVLSEADLIHRGKIGTEKHRAWWLEAVLPASVLALAGDAAGVRSGPESDRLGLCAVYVPSTSCAVPEVALAASSSRASRMCLPASLRSASKRYTKGVPVFTS